MLTGARVVDLVWHKAVRPQLLAGSPGFDCCYLCTPLGTTTSFLPMFCSIMARTSAADMDRFPEEVVFGVAAGCGGELRHVFKTGSRLLMKKD